MNSVCVFCGSSEGSRQDYVGAAREMGAEIARRGLTLVYGGGMVGLMGAVAVAALGEGGEVVGVMPRALVDKEISHKGLAKLHVVGSMHERKMLMNDLSDGFVTLPGGYGTLEEFLEVLSWAQLGIHAKPCALLDVSGFWEPLAALFDHAVTRASSTRTTAPSYSPRAAHTGCSTRWPATRPRRQRSGSTPKSCESVRATDRREHEEVTPWRA